MPFERGSSGGGRSFGLGGSYSPPKKDKDHWWEKGLNALEGIGSGMLTTAGHLIGDPVAEVFTLGRHESKIDDIAKAIALDYKHRYSSWDNFKDDPFSAVLDIATIASAFFSMGGSLAVRGASLTAGGATRFAGLTHSDELSLLSKAARGSAKDSPEFQAFAAKVAEEEARASSVLGRKGPLDRLLSGESGRVKVLDSGDVLVPQRGVLRGIDGTVLETVPLATSPYRRRIQRAGMGISNLDSVATKSVIGSEARAGKLHNRVARIKGENATARVLGVGGGNSLKRAMKKMAPEEEAALYARNVLGNAKEGPKALARMYRNNADEVERIGKMESYRQRRIHDTAKFADDVIKKATIKVGDDFTVNPALVVQVAKKERRELIAAAKKAKRTQDKERLREQAAAWRLVEQNAGDIEGYATRQSHLSQSMKDPDRIVNDLRRRAEIFNADRVEEVFRRPTDVMIRVERSEREAAKYTTDFIKGDLNKNVREIRPTMLAEMALGRKLTPEEEAMVVVRPHSRPAPKAKTVRELRNKDKFAKKPTAPKDRPSKVPTYSKRTTGYNFAFAQDSMTPASIFKVFNESRAYSTKMEVMRRAAVSGIKIDDTNAAELGFDSAVELKNHLVSLGHHEFVGGNSKLIEQAFELQHKLDNEIRLMVGPAMAREQTSNMLKELIEKATAEAGEFALPKAYHKFLTAELRRADNFVARMIDAPTAVFRAVVLTLRPAWIVNNFVGQMLLLLYSQGAMHGVREYMRAVNDTVRRNPAPAGALKVGYGTMAAELEDISKSAENATGLGWLVDHKWFRAKDEAGKPDGSLAAHTLSLAVRGLPSGVKGLSDLMGKLNAVLTDDIPRRAAFMGEVRPIVSRIQKLHPNMTADEALSIALKNEDTVARLVDKTMGDLIDFSRMSKVERDVVRRALPFYSWLKGMTFRAGRLVKDKPGTANLSYQVGRDYVENTEERWGGPVPEGLLGALKVGDRILPTAGMNIFQTPADVAQTVLSPLEEGGFKFGGSHPLSQLNPVFKAPLETAIGRDMFTGGPIYSDPSKGILNGGVADNPYTKDVNEAREGYKGIAGRYLSSLGPMALYTRYQRADEAEQDSTQGDPRLLQRDKRDSIAAYFGYPIADLNRAKAKEVAEGQSEYALVKYDPTAGEMPGVFGRARDGESKFGLA